MRRPFYWLLWAISVPLLCAAPVFGQAATPAPAQAPSYPAKEIAGFRVLFMQVMQTQALADQLKAQGKDDRVVRGAIQKSARLSDQETSLLSQVAQQCNASYDAQTSAGIDALNNLRAQYPLVPGAAPPAAVTQQAVALEAQRTAIIAGCMQQLQAGMGNSRFVSLDLWVLVNIVSHMQQGSFQPGAQGATAPKGVAAPK